MVLTDYIDFAVFFILLGLFLFIIFSQTMSTLHRVYLFLHLSFMHWALLQFASKATNLINYKFLLVQTSYLVLSTISVIFFVLSIFIINKTHWFRKWQFKLSLAPAMGMFLLALFNPNGWFIQEYVGPARDKEIGQGVLFNTLTIVSLFYIILVVFLLVNSYRKLTSATTRRHIAFTLIGLNIIVAFAIIDFVYNIVFIDHFDEYFPLITIGMLISACYMTFRINRNNVLNIISLAHRDVINTMSVGILVIDRDFYIIEMNKHIYKILPLKVGDILELKLIIEAFPYNDWDSILKLYENHAIDRYATISYDLVITKNPYRFAFIQCHPIIDSSDAILGYMYTIQDTTPMKNLVESTKSQNLLLQQRNAELIETQEQLYTVNKKLELIAITDPLTECYNRRYLFQLLETKIPYNIEHEIPFSVILIDLDFFKNINDEYGHLAGDNVLKCTAQKLKSSVGEYDVVARFGGEEFIVFFDNVIVEEARIKINNLKSEIENNEIFLDDAKTSVFITVSIGVVSINQFEIMNSNGLKNLQYDIIGLADHALYEAKNLGRNTIAEKRYVFSNN